MRILILAGTAFLASLANKALDLRVFDLKRWGAGCKSHGLDCVAASCVTRVALSAWHEWLHALAIEARVLTPLVTGSLLVGISIQHSHNTTDDA